MILNCHSVSPLRGITTSMQNEMAGLGYGGLKPFIHGQCFCHFMLQEKKKG